MLNVLAPQLDELGLGPWKRTLAYFNIEAYEAGKNGNTLAKVLANILTGLTGGVVTGERGSINMGHFPSLSISDIAASHGQVVTSTAPQIFKKIA